MNASATSKRSYATLLAEKAGRRARESLFGFARYVAPRDYHFNWHHATLYRYLDDFAAGRRKRLVVEMPPGHSKSEGVSRNLPAYLLGRNPDARVIACSYTADLASEMNRDVQRVLDSADYKALYPGTRLAGRGSGGAARRNADIFDVVGRRGYYKSAGVGGGITGRRFDFGIIDDPVKDREAAESPTQREAVWRWFTSTFMTRQARGASVCITLTRWHRDDLVGRLVRQAADTAAAEPWDVLTLPAIATDRPHPDDPRRPGEPLWPWFKSLADLERQRALEPRDFAALYQQNPTAEGGTEWPPGWFDSPDIWFADWPRNLVVRGIALDPSKGRDSKFGDYSAYVFGGLTPDNTLWLDADIRRRPTPEIVADGVELQRTFRGDTFAVETNAFQELLVGEFSEAAAKAGVMLPVVGVTNSAPKPVRIRRLGPYLARGAVRFRGGSPGAKLLVEQLRDFPTAAHDDGPDAAEMLLRALTNLLAGGRK
jgi:predicted phage terminase large subunit-like protein